MPGAQWYTPVAYQKNREEAWGKIEAHSWQIPKIQLEKEITYFNNTVKFQRLQEYDLYFAYSQTFPLWDKRRSRDNRRYLPDIRENIFQQEKDKPVPVLSSMNYGRGTSCDVNESTFRRKSAISDFKRRRGIMNEAEEVLSFK